MCKATRDCFPTIPPWRNAWRLGPFAHDLCREITLGDPAQVGAYPSRQPFRLSRFAESDKFKPGLDHLRSHISDFRWANRRKT